MFFLERYTFLHEEEIGLLWARYLANLIEASSSDGLEGEYSGIEDEPPASYIVLEPSSDDISGVETIVVVIKDETGGAWLIVDAPVSYTHLRAHET